MINHADIEAFTPVAILLISAIFKIQQLNQKLVGIVVVSSPTLLTSQGVVLIRQMISVGCALAAYGELHFEMSGFLCQASAVVVSLPILADVGDGSRADG
jgi:hypothetical protein